MRNIIIIILVLCRGYGSAAQKVHAYTGVHINTTLYDRTITNNAIGFGAWLRASVNTNSFFNPEVEVSASAYGGTKELYVTADDKPIYAKSGVATVMVGTMINLSHTFYTGLLAGPAFFNSKTYMGLQPVMGCYLTKKQIITVRVSFTNIFQHDDIGNKNFGYLGFGAGIKLF